MSDGQLIGDQTRTQPAEPVTYELASWGVRAGAYLIDGLILLSVGFAVVAGAYIAEGGDNAESRRLAELLLYTIFVPISLAYAPLLMVRRGERNGQSLGKQALRIRVVRESGQEVTLGNATLREVIGRQLLVAFTYGLYAVIDYLWPLWDRSRQCLHDKVAQTRVVRVEPVDPHAARFTTDAGQTPAAQAAATQPTSGLAPAPPPPAPAPADDVPVRDGWLPPTSGR